MSNVRGGLAPVAFVISLASACAPRPIQIELPERNSGSASLFVLLLQSAGASDASLLYDDAEGTFVSRYVGDLDSIDEAKSMLLNLDGVDRVTLLSAAAANINLDLNGAVVQLARENVDNVILHIGSELTDCRLPARAQIVLSPGRMCFLPESGLMSLTWVADADGQWDSSPQELVGPEIEALRAAFGLGIKN